MRLFRWAINLSSCVLSHFNHVRLCATPWTVAHQAPLSMEILQARILEWVVMLSSSYLPHSGIKLMSPSFPALVQFSYSVVSDSLWPHGLQNTRLHCPSPTLGSLESVIPSNNLILCHPLFLLPSIFSSIRVFSNESVLCIRWPKYWSFSFSPPNEYSGLFPLGWTGWISLGLSTVFCNTTVQEHQFFGAQLYAPTLTCIHDYWKNHSLD